MDTKLRNRIIRTGVVCVILVVGVLICLGLYHLADDTWNGMFVDWFSSHYVIRYPYINEAGMMEYMEEVNWEKLKPLVLTVMIANVLLWLVVTLVSSWLYAKKRIKESVTDISRLIREYIQTEGEASEIFPKEYAEISTQMAEIKSVMQHHEQILRDEAGKKNELITYLAHDLKTPLTSVIGYLSLMDEAPDMPAEQKAKYVNIALDKAYRLEKLINEFFEITRYNLQQINLEKEQIDLSYMLIQMADEFYPILNTHGNTIRLCVDENLSICGDSMRLARVFNNILKNAIAYSDQGTEIEIRARQDEENVELVFCNRGRTIPEQKLNSIFEKFFRLDEARTSNTGGAGLGLAIAKEIVQLHGGTIGAASKDGVTEFKVTLPLT